MPPIQRTLYVKNGKYNPFLAPASLLSHNSVPFSTRGSGLAHRTHLLAGQCCWDCPWHPGAGTQQSHHHIPECSADSWPTKKTLPDWQGNVAHVAHEILLIPADEQEEAAVTEMKGDHRRGKSREHHWHLMLVAQSLQHGPAVSEGWLLLS